MQDERIRSHVGVPSRIAHVEDRVGKPLEVDAVLALAVMDAIVDAVSGSAEPQAEGAVSALDVWLRARRSGLADPWRDVKERLRRIRIERVPAVG